MDSLLLRGEIIKYIKTFKKIYKLTHQKIYFAKKSGGLRYMDLKTGSILQPILENASEGVCTIHADFTGVGNLFQNDFLRLSNYYSRSLVLLEGHLCFKGS